LLSGPIASSHGHVHQRWSARGLHAPTLSFSVSARVGHGPLFLVSAGGRKGFRRSAVTGVVFLYGACCSRAGAGEFFRRRLLDVFCLFVVVFSLFFLFKSVYGFQILLVCF
jgi:hypothetical protein